MKKKGSRLFGIGVSGFLIAGSALDCRSWMLALALTVIFGCIAFIGALLMNDNKKMEVKRIVDCKRGNADGLEEIRRNREQTFRTWISSTGVDNSL